MLFALLLLADDDLATRTRVEPRQGAGVTSTPAALFGDDAALVRRYTSGDRKALELLVARHARLAGAVAFSVVGDYHAAKDVVQEAFVKVMDGLGALDEPERFRGWLRNVVRTTALDHLRRRKVTGRAADALPGQDDEEGPPLPAPDIRPDDLLANAELRALIRDEVAALGESQREVVILKYLDGRSYEEIADITGLSVATIESRLFRARATLRRRLAARLGASPEEGPS